MDKKEFDKYICDTIKWFNSREDKANEIRGRHDDNVKLLQKIIDDGKLEGDVDAFLKALFDQGKFYEESYIRLKELVKNAEQTTQRTSIWGTSANEYMSVRDFLDDDD